MGTIITIGKKQDPALDLKQEKIEKKLAFRAYARLSNPEELNTASSLETIHSFFIPLGVEKDEHQSDTLIIVDRNSEQYELIHRNSNQDTATSFKDVRVTIPVEMFTSLRNLAKVGYKYKLYKFPVLDRGDLFWEVMQFWGNDGQLHPWVVISIEADDDYDPKLPFTIKECILENDPNNSDEVNNFIVELWNKQYSKIDERDIIKR